MRRPSNVPEHPTLRGDILELVRKLAPEAADESSSDVGVLERITLEGKKVLVVGAGVGDTCRAARSLGAAIVDGFEPDDRLVRVGRLLNVYHQTSRVSMYHREIARPDAYNEPYDVVLFLAPFDAFAGVLDRVAGMTDGLLVTALPDLDESLALVVESFKHHEVLDADGGLVVVAHSRESLAAAVRFEAAATAPR
jgi:hypothetical protein